MWDQSIHVKSPSSKQSIGMNYNFEAPDSEKPGESPNSVYLLPYNPNNAFGLNGDLYYRGSRRVFHTQPKIPDLKESFVFKQTFVPARKPND